MAMSVPVYRIHRLRDSAREQFRWAPHAIGVSLVKPKDYEVSDISVEAQTPYAAWTSLKQDSDNALRPGDVLEGDNGELRIYKYVGFEEAQWQVPENTLPAAPQVAP
jgi:hypothetical protein